MSVSQSSEFIAPSPEEIKVDNNRDDGYKASTRFRKWSVASALSYLEITMKKLKANKPFNSSTRKISWQSWQNQRRVQTYGPY